MLELLYLGTSNTSKGDNATSTSLPAVDWDKQLASRESRSTDGNKEFLEINAAYHISKFSN